MNKIKKILKSEDAKHYGLLLLIILIGVVLRLWNLDKESLRLDEAQSIWQASHSLNFIKDYMVKNVHLPLHNSLLHFWIRFFGPSEISVRLMSAIPGILALPALYLLSREVLDKKLALVVIIIASISPFWVWYSREIRMYTLLTLVSILSYYFFLRILKKGSLLEYIGYFIINLIGIYTHYFFLLALGVQAMYFILFYLRNNQYSSLKDAVINKGLYLAFTAVLLLLFYAPWIGLLYSGYGSGSYAPVLGTPSSFNMFLSLFEFVFGYQPENFTSLTISLWPLAILLGFLFLSRRYNPISKEIKLIFLGAFVPIVLVYFVSISFKSIYLTRYLVPSAPLFLIFLVWFVYTLGEKFRYMSLLFLLSLLVYSLYLQFFSYESPARENYRDAVNYIESQASPRDIVLTSPPYTIYPVEYYYNSPVKINTLPLWNKKKGGIPVTTEELVSINTVEIKEGHEKAYLLITMNLEGSDIVKRYYDMNFTKLDKKQFSKNLWVHVYQLEYR